MKERYTISIADIQLNILSDEPEDYVHFVVGQLDQIVREMTMKNQRCSKLDAALLCALDSLSEKNKSDKRIKNLEAQISLYEATIKRLRQDIAQMQQAGIPKPAPQPIKEILKEDAALFRKEEKPAEAKPAAKELKEKTPVQVPLNTVSEEAPRQADTPAEEKPEEEKPALQNAKLRQIEELLRRRSEDGAGDDAAESASENSSRDAKLREIEELLRKNGGGQSLSEALHDAIRS